MNNRGQTTIFLFQKNPDSDQIGKKSWSVPYCSAAEFQFNRAVPGAGPMRTDSVEPLLRQFPAGRASSTLR